MKMMRRIAVLALALALLCGSALAEYRELTVGSKDTSGDWSVYSLQLKLIELDYLEGVADGIFGNGTAEAVAAFQADHGLEATGVADAEMQEVLFSVQPEATPTAEPGATPAPDEEVLDAGDAGNDVMILQGKLFQWGFLTAAPDGILGSGTKNALATFQSYALEDMVAYTDAKLAERMAEATPEPTPVPRNEDGSYDMPAIADEALPTYPTDGTLTEAWFDYILNGFDPTLPELHEGDSSKDVKRMQTRLMALEYMGGGNDGGFGEHTKVALKYFQLRNGLEQTGYLDEATAAALLSSDAAYSDRYVSLYKAMVSVTDQRVYIYKWTGEDYTALVHTFLCSTGVEESPTILGTFQAPGRNGEWYWMEDSKVWVKYAFVIDGGYFFHSVLYPTQDSKPTAGSVKALGTRASHGCVRLSAEDAEWIYNNCASGMTVVIYED